MGVFPAWWASLHLVVSLCPHSPVCSRGAHSTPCLPSPGSGGTAAIDFTLNCVNCGETQHVGQTINCPNSQHGSSSSVSVGPSQMGAQKQVCSTACCTRTPSCAWVVCPLTAAPGCCRLLTWAHHQLCRGQDGTPEITCTCVPIISTCPRLMQRGLQVN